MPRCADAVALALAFDLAPDARARVALEEARVAAWRAVDPTAVGVLLPLSGPYARLGEAAREALELAFAPYAPGLRLFVRDTAGDADQAARLATELVSNDRVAALIGPIGRKESAAVATVARLFAVPQVPLASEIPAAPDRDLPDPILRVRTSASDLVVAVARHARAELGLTRVASLVPDTEAGREAAAAFAAELERLGGVVVRQVLFDQSVKDPADALKSLLALPDKQKRPGKHKPDFEALFIPADAPTVRRLVPFLAYWGIHPRTAPGDTGRVQLLGGSGWSHATVVDKGEHLTDNAVFADVYVPDDPDAQDFARRFFLHASRRPTAFHAEVWDATRLLAETLVGLPADRLAIRDAFSRPRAYPGATGPLEVLASGQLRPRAHLLTIDGDLIRRRLSEDEERALRLSETPPEVSP